MLLGFAVSDADKNAGTDPVGSPSGSCPGEKLDEMPPGGTPPGTLIVKVINDEDGSTVNPFTVQIKGSIVDSQPTGSSGEAVFSGVPSGPYDITHSDKCFLPASGKGKVEDGKTTRAELHVKPTHAVLTVKELAFSGHNAVENDTMGVFKPAEWAAGRKQDDQAPVAYARNKKVSFNVKFSVVICRAEDVEVRGSATFGAAALKWSGSVHVAAGATEASIDLTSDNPLPNEVGIFESTDITWEMNPSKLGWSAAGTTRNTVYVTLGDPQGTPSFWTLLDISCRAAAGQTTETDVITKCFAAFTGRNLSRKRDGKMLRYWFTPFKDCTAASTAQMLRASVGPDGIGAGQCGAWASFMIDMFKAHGIVSADKILIDLNPAEGFLVKAWIFDHPPASAAAAYTHFRPSQARPGARVAAQNSTDSPEHFMNHFIVLVLGKFWDPSYGNGPFADQKAWENASIDGLFRLPPSGVPAPSGSIEQIGFDKSLNAGTNLLKFTNLTTGKVI